MKLLHIATSWSHVDSLNFA